jgi:hypothetical protein
MNMVSVALTVAAAIFNRSHRIVVIVLRILSADNTVQNESLHVYV